MATVLGGSEYLLMHAILGTEFFIAKSPPDNSSMNFNPLSSPLTVNFVDQFDIDAMDILPSKTTNISSSPAQRNYKSAPQQPSTTLIPHLLTSLSFTITTLSSCNHT
ncbi:uncharacterized protein ATC70_008114 [Mucor velutinosus]|uniref:Uncharacterized protein n=1 Tax=Mucor velutinosus TaxID=708070 RepID=A0AAN7D486_9FUNG|nr:hypothetical protein ATC70_008114 [Mucor velutinosus]